MSKYLTAGLALLLTGCVNFTDNSGTRHYVVIGFGVISVSRTNQPIQVIKNQLVGAEFQTLPVGFSAGYKSSTEMSVATNVSANIEIQNSPFKPLKVEIQQ